MRSGASDLKQGDHPDGPEAATLVLESPEDLEISNYHGRMPTSADGEEARSQGRSHLVKIKVSAWLRPSCRLWQRLFLVFPIFWGAGVGPACIPGSQALLCRHGRHSRTGLSCIAPSTTSPDSLLTVKDPCSDFRPNRMMSLFKVRRYRPQLHRRP